MFGMVYIVFLISHLGAFCILDGVSDILYSEFDISEDISLFGVGTW